jgi:hypothetical protein
LTYPRCREPVEEAVMKLLRACVFPAVGLWFVSAVPAQGPQKPQTGPVPAPAPEAAFHYVEGRAPFENLTLVVRDKGRPREIRSVEDLLVEEVVVAGIFQREGRYHALVRGSGLKRSETITVGRKLYNGEVIEIGPVTDENTGERKLCVVFRVRTDDPIRPFIRRVKCAGGL